MNHHSESPWDPYLLSDFDHTAVGAAANVLDIGCGPGEELQAFAESGPAAFGLDINQSDLMTCRTKNLRVFMAVAEHLPCRDGAFDAVLCKVVIPYTDERRAIEEISRILSPGGTAIIVYHGLGYFLYYGIRGPGVKFRIYGWRTLANTIWYRVSGHRLPGFVGDSLAQTPSALQRYYHAFNLELIQETPAPRFAGHPVFIYHTVRRT